MQGFAEAFTHLMDTLERASYVMAAVGALSSVFHGNRPAAQQTLNKLPPDVLHELSTAAAVFSMMASETAAAAREVAL